MSTIITITGDIEVTRLLNRLATGLTNEVIIPELDSWATDIHAGFIEREHVWSGEMKASTKKTGSGEKREVRVDKPYAEKENRRWGSKGAGKGTGHGTPHQFVEPTLAEVNPRHFDILIQKITRFINSN